MANLVDDFKNWIPGGIRIREDIVTVPNSDNPITPLDLYEIVICENFYISGVNPVNIYFSSDVTQDCIVFNVPRGNATTSYSGLSNSANYKSFTDARLNGSFIQLYPYLRYNDSGTKMQYDDGMYWLVLRIA